MKGASYADEFTCDKELTNLAARHPEDIKFVHTVSRPDEERSAGWKGTMGQVNTIVEEYLECFNPPMDDAMVYACGHPGMVEAGKWKIRPNGWKYQEESFWKSGPPRILPRKWANCPDPLPGGCFHRGSLGIELLA